MNTPETLADLTPQWLSQALSPTLGVNVSVSAVEIVQQHDGTTGRGLIRLSYHGDVGNRDAIAEDHQGSSTAPQTLFVKLPPQDKMQRAFVTAAGMGRREVDFYLGPAQYLPVDVPRCYHAECDARGERYIMLLEDLNSRNCQFRNASRHYSMEYVEQVVSDLGSMHGHFAESHRFQSDLNWLSPPQFSASGPVLVERALSQHGATQEPLFSEFAEFYLANAAAIHDVWSRGQPTLVHGDVHDGNLYRYQDRAGFLDWALVSKSSGMRDLGYFLVGSVRPEDRRQHEAGLIELYRSMRRQAGAVEPPSTVDLWQEYRWHAAYTWLASACTLAAGDDWQPLNYVNKSLLRVHEALRDLGSLEALRESLNP